MADNRLTPIEALQIKLYQVIEQQAVLQAEFNRLEQAKAELAKELGTARRTEQESFEPSGMVERAATAATNNLRQRRPAVVEANESDFDA